MTPIPTLLSIILAGENLTRKDPQRQIKKATTEYKSPNGLAPDYLCSKFTYRGSVTNYSLRETNGKLAIPDCHSFIHSFVHSFIHSFKCFYLTRKKIRKDWLFTIYKKNSGNFGREFSVGKNGTCRLPFA